MGPQQVLDNFDYPDFIYYAGNDSEMVDVLNIDFNRLVLVQEIKLKDFQ